MDNAGNSITEPEEVRETWRQYIESLYDKDEKSKIYKTYRLKRENM